MAIAKKVKETKPVEKAAVKKVKKEKAVEVVNLSKINTKAKKLSADVFDLSGKVVEQIVLPAEVFGAKVNKVLIAQAVRVYRANQRLGTASTKTRGEVEGSTRKIYRQKGTGRARHGSIRAPIFVHGGIVGGPKPRDYSLKMPKKMKKAALFGSISAKYVDSKISIVDGLAKIEPKTKKFIGLIESIKLNENKKKVLLVTAGAIESLKRAARNVEGITIANVNTLNTYDVLNNRHLLFMKEAIAEIDKNLKADKKEVKEVKK